MKNYRCLQAVDVTLNSGLNVIVGNNEAGKSTLLEAINLALTGQLNGRPIQTELHPHLFNANVVSTYIADLTAKKSVQPPSIEIELYFADDPMLAKLKGINNSAGLDLPGTVLTIEFNQDYADEFASYVADPSLIRTLPIEYYIVRWRSFDDNDITSRAVPIKPAFIDASTIKNNSAASRYVIDIVRDSLSKEQRVDLALSYRMMKDSFMDDVKVKGVNGALAKIAGEISDKTLSVSLDTSSRSSWEFGVMPHLDDVPLTLVGKGEQNAIKIKLAMESAGESHLVLIEEPENHLSFSNLNKLISHISHRHGARQLIITTHSSFVLNKLGVNSVILFNRDRSLRLNNLSDETQRYFMRLPGHDTLRLILSTRAILVEGPSDELIVQAAFLKKHGKLPLDVGVDIISVNSLAFKRFLEIADLLQRRVAVVTDNDGDVARLEKKYAPYEGKAEISIHYDQDETFKTLEPQLLRANGRDVIERVLGETFGSDEELLEYMQSNKADCALQFFLTSQPWTAPEYINHAIC
ncbi:AAA family ATPase [Burkholderia cenocepacia]|nr:AAA family ATPase [Burkholderia cenocepacia]MBR8291943.1 AAA family ATPase [Burkholderia cenocepacia]MBR8499333.1 AAA family ATPase [Burkholderia cenocepacia]USB83306.1 AAA family ATPase [Burkholderia cenocepacia]